MPKINCFEDIESWRRARALANAVYDLTEKGAFARDFGLKDQIRRSAVSIMSNIAEGFESQTDRSFLSYLFRARGSAGEVRSHLYIACDRQYISRRDLEIAQRLALETSRRIARFISYLESNQFARNR